MALSNVLKRRRGTEDEHKTFVGDEGEITVVTTRQKVISETEVIDDYPVWELRVHDGSTAGGHRIPTYDELVEYLDSRKIGYNNLDEILKTKIDDIDNKLSKTEADSTYRKKDVSITLEDLANDVKQELQKPNDDLDQYKLDILNSGKDETKGSSLVGYIATPNGFGSNATSISTVKEAIDNLGDRVSANTGSISTLSTQVSEFSLNMQSLKNSVSNFNSRLDIAEPKIKKLREDVDANATKIETNARNITAEAARVKDYTDNQIKTLATDRIDALRSDLTDLTDNVYTINEIDEIKTALETKDNTLTDDLSALTNRVKNIEDIRYTVSGIYEDNNTELKSYSLNTIGTAIDDAVAHLVNSSPEALDTLKELAEALGNDANFAATMNEELAKKANLTDFNILKNTVDGTLDEPTTGLVYRTTALETGLATTNSRVTTLEGWVNGYENVPGLLSRVATIETALGTGGTESTLDAIKERLTALETLTTQHANILNSLENVAFSGRYDDLIGKPSIPKGYYTGSNTFNSKDGRRITVPANYQSEGNTYSVLISPKSNPTGNIGEVWITKDVSYFTVYCSGATRTTTFDYVIFNNDSRTVEGVTN